MEYTLSVDELAMAMSLMGKSDVAKGIVQSNFPEIDESEAKGRLLAAADSLVIRGLVTTTDIETSAVLESELKSILEIMASPSSILTISRSGDIEATYAFYFKDNQIAQQQIEHGLSHKLSQIESSSDILTLTTQLFEIDGAVVPEVEDLELEFSMLDKAKELAVKEPAALLLFLKDHGVPDKTAAFLAEDLISMGFRGAVSKNELRKDEITSTGGMLLLKGADRAWLFRILTGRQKGYVKSIAFRKASFIEEIESLMKSDNVS